jgi:stress-induced morphogen
MGFSAFRGHNVVREVPRVNAPAEVCRLSRAGGVNTTHASGASMFSAQRIEAILLEKLPGCRTRVVNDMDDGEHFSAEVTSSAFIGKNRVQQHQLVYGALGDHMRRDIHALALRTYLPDQWPYSEVS